MSMKTFYQFDPSGYLISEVLCQESPLEPGKYLIPEKCTEVIRLVMLVLQGLLQIPAELQELQMKPNQNHLE